MSDTNAILDQGYEVVSTTVGRVITRNDKIINMDFELENKSLRVHFNEHHDLGKNKPSFCQEFIKKFIEESSDILHGLGYEMEGEV